MENKLVSNIKHLGFTWETMDPFLFCVHHQDNYPKGNELMGPDVPLNGKILGNDFTVKDGFRMYHGEIVPGFPAHPHRGFETVTVVLKGLIDHSDSQGAAGRYGNGDVQWMTAGEGLQHSEMFPSLNKNADNPLELFQIWLNLSKSKKHAKPYYAMLWSEDIPIYSEKDKNGKLISVSVIVGNLGNVTALSPAPDSWAADPDNELGIWLIKMEADALWTFPVSSQQINRTIYFYKGLDINIEGVELTPNHSAELAANKPINIKNGNEEGLLLLLQGRPIKEPVAQYGPFVLNTAEEVQKAFMDYSQNEFGGWPWPSREIVHPRERGRFAKYSDGREEVR